MPWRTKSFERHSDGLAPPSADRLIEEEEAQADERALRWVGGVGGHVIDVPSQLV